MQIMTFVVLTGALVGVVWISVLVNRMAAELAVIRDLLKDVSTALAAQIPIKDGRLVRLSHYGHKHRQRFGGFFTIWEWRESEKTWTLVSAIVPPGFDPGSPPSYPGAFDGDHVKKWVPEEPR
jgi:hypothetical protein